MPLIPKITQAKLNCYGMRNAETQKKPQPTPQLCSRHRDRLAVWPTLSACILFYCCQVLWLRKPKQSYFNQQLPKWRSTITKVLIRVQRKMSPTSATCRIYRTFFSLDSQTQKTTDVSNPVRQNTVKAAN